LISGATIQCSLKSLEAAKTYDRDSSVFVKASLFTRYVALSSRTLVLPDIFLVKETLHL
jgi:hypothetical protein